MEDDEKLIPPPAADAIFLEGKLPEYCCELAEHQIANLMSIGVIYLFEAVDVNEEEHVVFSHLRRDGEQSIEIVFHGGTVQKAG